MPETDIAEKEPITFVNVRWKMPSDAMKLITDHQKVLALIEKRDVSQQYAAIDLIRSKKLPKVVIVHD